MPTNSLMKKWAVFVCFQTAHCKPTDFRVLTLREEHLPRQRVSVIRVTRFPYERFRRRQRHNVRTLFYPRYAARCVVRIFRRDGFSVYITFLKFYYSHNKTAIKIFDCRFVIFKLHSILLVLDKVLHDCFLRHNELMCIFENHRYIVAYTL